MALSLVGINDVIVSLITAIVCAIIYAKTQEPYRLTRKVTVSNFRKTFLYFALLFTLRVVFRLAYYTYDNFQQAELYPLLSTAIGYVGIMAWAYMLFAVCTKTRPHWTVHVAAIVIGMVSTALMLPQILLLTHSLILVALVVCTIVNKNRASSIYYILMVLWLTLLISFTLQIAYIIIPTRIAILIIFFIILSKVLKWIK